MKKKTAKKTKSVKVAGSKKIANRTKKVSKKAKKTVTKISTAMEVIEGGIAKLLRISGDLSSATKSALLAKNWPEYGAMMARLQTAQTEFEKEFPAIMSKVVAE